MSENDADDLMRQFRSLVLHKQSLREAGGGETERAEIQRRIEEIGRAWSLNGEELLEAEKLVISKHTPIIQGKTVFITDAGDLRGTFVLHRSFLLYPGYIIIGLSLFGFIMNATGQGFLRSLHPDTLGILLFFAAIGAILVKLSGYGLRKIRFEDDGSVGAYDKGRYELIRFEDYRYALFISTGRYVYYIRKVILCRERPSFLKKLIKEISPVNMGDDMAIHLLYWRKEEGRRVHIAPGTLCDYLLDSCKRAGFKIEYNSSGLPVHGSRGK